MDIAAIILSIIFIGLLSLLLFIFGYVKFTDPPSLRRKGVPSITIREEGIWMIGLTIALITLMLFIVVFGLNAILDPKSLMLITFTFGAFFFIFTGGLCFRNLLLRTNKELPRRGIGIICIAFGVCFALSSILAGILL